MTVVLGIIMLGILVFVHELGHFLVAKACGVKVLKFSLGFGPKLVGKRWGETEYMICAVPLGGYVQMLGEGGGEQGEDAPLTPAEIERSFAHKSVGKRVAIVAAGPLMNLALPFLILPFAFMAGAEIPEFLYDPACIEYVEIDKPAGVAGFEPGDCIISIGNENVVNWHSGNMALVSSAGDSIPITVNRNGVNVDLIVNPKNSGLDGLSSLGIQPAMEAIVGGIFKDDPAHKAGIEPGDKILEISGTKVGSWYDMVSLIKEGQGREESILLERDGNTLTVSVTPQLAKDGRYLIGIRPFEKVEIRKFGFEEAVREGRDQALELMTLTVIFLKKLFTGDVSLTNLGGPVTVIELAGSAAQSGVSSLLTILAFISIQLGILNLLPIPILDGGHLFFYIIELVIRRPIPMQIREPAQQIGLFLLLALMGFVIYLDIARKFASGG